MRGLRRLPRREAAKRTAAARSPRLLPIAMAAFTRGTSGPGDAVGVLGRVDPPVGHDLAGRAGTVGATAQQVAAAGERKLEEALVFGGLAEHHAEHRAMAGVDH